MSYKVRLLLLCWFPGTRYSVRTSVITLVKSALTFHCNNRLKIIDSWQQKDTASCLALAMMRFSIICLWRDSVCSGTEEQKSLLLNPLEEDQGRIGDVTAYKLLWFNSAHTHRHTHLWKWSSQGFTSKHKSDFGMLQSNSYLNKYLQPEHKIVHKR